MKSTELPPESAAFYRGTMSALQEAGVPFLVGGAYAFACYTEIARHTKDFDLFVKASDLDEALAVLARNGYRTEITFPHWLAKAYAGEDAIDLIFRSGNGLAEVDDTWFTRAEEHDVLGIPAGLCPPEEIIWTKAFVMERERYDGSDVAHLLHRCGGRIDWDHLLELFGSHWRVLLSHLILFGFIYPSERGRVPQAVLERLLLQLRDEQQQAPPVEAVCRGTLLSRAQYLVDVEAWGYTDARLWPQGEMTQEEIESWTAAIDEDDLPHAGRD